MRARSITIVGLLLALALFGCRPKSQPAEERVPLCGTRMPNYSHPPSWVCLVMDPGVSNRITLLDITGRELALIADTVPATPDTICLWNVDPKDVAEENDTCCTRVYYPLDSLESGVYIYLLKTPDTVKAKKFVIMR